MISHMTVTVEDPREGRIALGLFARSLTSRCDEKGVPPPPANCQVTTGAYKGY
jgi:hypothetical protein